MDTTELVQCWVRFFNIEKIYDKIQKSLIKGKQWVKIDYLDIAQHSVELSEQLLDDPKEVIETANMALNEFDLGTKDDDSQEPIKLSVRIFKLPPSCLKYAWQIRVDDIGKFIALKGVISKNTGVLQICDSAKYQCSGCGNILNVNMDNTEKLKVPQICKCGRKTGFIMIESLCSDNIKIGVADDLMDEANRERRMAREKIAILKNELTCQVIDNLVRAGSKVVVNGYLRYIKKTATFDSELVVNSIEFIEAGWHTIKITEKQKEIFQKTAQLPTLITDMAESISDVEGYPEVKIALLLQLAGAPHIYDNNGHLESRGTIHVLLIGDPGCGKTYLAKRAGSINPIYSFQSASTSSGRGLVASVAQDKELGTWVIYPGVIPLSNKGVAVIDEIDKTNEDDYGDHNNAMNDMRVPIAKANVKGILDTETNYLATANPKDRIFSTYDNFINQIEMPKDFLDRFDLILPMLPPKTQEKRDKIMDIMLERHMDVPKKQWTPKYSHKFMRQYLAYCHQAKDRPVLPFSLLKRIKEELHALMKPKNEEQVRVSYRHLESILRFAYGSARLHLRDVTEEDIMLAFKLKKASFIALGIIDESGAFNWVVEENIDEKKIASNIKLMDLLNELIPRKEIIDMELVIVKCVEAGLDRFKVEEDIEKMRKIGILYEPKRGMIGWTG